MEHLWQNVRFLPNESKFYHVGTQLNATANDTAERPIEDILLEILGPTRSPFFLPVTIIYLVIFLTGLCGNLLTCAVIARRKKMRSPTNLYLVSLAVSDLLVLLFGMPLEVYDLWQNYPFPFGTAGCYFKTFLFETVCFASILNVTALSAERYVAVVYPLKARYLCTGRHAQRVIASVWAVSMVCAVPNMSLHGISYLPGRMAESAICTVLTPIWVYSVLIQITAVCFYFLPMAVISVLYLVMAAHLGRDEPRPRGGDVGKSGSSSSPWKIQAENGRRKQVIKMLSIVVTVFGVCWAPFHIERFLWSSISQWTDLMHAVYQCIHIVSGILFYLSSAVNPIIYSLLSTRFRQGFRELLCSQAEDNPSFKGSPAFPKILCDSSTPSQVEDKDPLAFTPLLTPNTAFSIDTTVLTVHVQTKNPT